MTDPRPDDAMAELKPPFRFDRYVNGERMAEGIRINRAANLDAAIRKAVEMCPEPGTVLVAHSAPAREVTGEVVEACDGSVMMEEHATADQRWCLRAGRYCRLAGAQACVRNVSATPAPARGREDDWELEQRAFTAANAAQSVEVYQELVRDLWRAYCAMEVRALSKPVLSAEVGEMVERLRQYRPGGVEVEAPFPGVYAERRELANPDGEDAADMLERLAQGRTFEDGLEAAAKVCETFHIAPASTSKRANYWERQVVRPVLAAAIRALADPDIRLESDYGQQ